MGKWESQFKEREKLMALKYTKRCPGHCSVLLVRITASHEHEDSTLPLPMALLWHTLCSHLPPIGLDTPSAMSIPQFHTIWGPTSPQTLLANWAQVISALESPQTFLGFLSFFLLESLPRGRGRQARGPLPRAHISLNALASPPSHPVCLT